MYIKELVYHIIPLPHLLKSRETLALVFYFFKKRADKITWGIHKTFPIGLNSSCSLLHLSGFCTEWHDNKRIQLTTKFTKAVVFHQKERLEPEKMQQASCSSPMWIILYSRYSLQLKILSSMIVSIERQLPIVDRFSQCIALIVATIVLSMWSLIAYHS